MSTYSPSLRIELITTGDQAGSWGTTTNTNLGTLVEAAIAGYTSVSITSANQALTALDGAADQSRNMVLALTTTTGAAFNVYAPPAEKTYVIQNASSFSATIFNSTVIGNTTAAGTGVVVPAGKKMFVFSEGTNFTEALDHITGSLSVGGALAVTGAATVTGLTTANGGLAVTGTATVGGVAVVTTTGTQTLTNKRVTPRVNAQTTTASPFAWNSDSYDQQSFSALANALTISADAGTPTDGQKTIFRFKDNGTARALTWTTGTSKSFRPVGVTLPTTTNVGKTQYVGCIYNAADARWDAVGTAQEA